jgi:glycosyltransferase involved in cell wall biosynthesis
MKDRPIQSAIPSTGVALKDFCVIYFGNDWFGENRTSSHHIAARLGAVAPVLYIETPGIRAPKASGRDFRKLFRKISMAFQPPRKVDEQFWLITMPQIPFRNLPFAGLANRTLGQYLVRRALKHLGFRKTLSWFVVPHPGELAKRLGEHLTIYYCIDDYAAFPGVDREAIAKLDDDLTRRADIVFVAGPTLIESKKKLNSVVEFSPHGVDVDMFALASDPTTVAPPETRDLQRPIIGYFGTLGEWIDVDLIAHLARSRPSWTFLIIGFAAADPGDLKNLPNVILAGPKPYRTLPQWAKVFHAAIIPYRHTQQVENANPLKLREYLATGKPVVAVPTPEIQRFADHIYLADTREDFLRMLERAMEEDSEDRRNSRMAAVAGLSWDARFREVARIVERELDRKVKGTR